MTKKERMIMAVVEATRGIPVCTWTVAFPCEVGIAYLEMRFYLN